MYSHAHTHKRTLNDKHVSCNFQKIEYTKWCGKILRNTRKVGVQFASTLICFLQRQFVLWRPSGTSRFASVVVDLHFNCNCFGRFYWGLLLLFPKKVHCINPFDGPTTLANRTRRFAEKKVEEKIFPSFSEPLYRMGYVLLTTPIFGCQQNVFCSILQFGTLFKTCSGAVQIECTMKLSVKWLVY